MGPAVRAVLLRASCRVWRSGGLHLYVALAGRTSMGRVEDDVHQCSQKAVAVAKAKGSYAMCGVRRWPDCFSFNLRV